MGQGMDKILPGVYVGNFRDSKDRAQLERHNITHILAIHDTAKKLHEDIEYLCISASDTATQDIKQYFPQTNDFIHKARLSGGNVLIHCLAGVSRSVTVTVAYIMTITNLEWRYALNAVRGARRVANPNFGFQRQLQEYQHETLEQARKKLKGKYGPNPFEDDVAILKKQLDIHRQWILLGDTPSEAEDSKMYPLGYKAYKSRQDAKKKAEDESLTKEPVYDPTAEGCSVDCQCLLDLNDKTKIKNSTCGIILHKNPKASRVCVKGSAKAMFGSSVDRPEPEAKSPQTKRFFQRERSKSLDKGQRARSASPVKEQRSNSLKGKQDMQAARSILPQPKPSSPKGKASKAKNKSPKGSPKLSPKGSPKQSRRSLSPKKSIDYESNLIYKIDTSTYVKDSKPGSPLLVYAKTMTSAKPTKANDNCEEQTQCHTVPISILEKHHKNQMCTVLKESSVDERDVTQRKKDLAQEGNREEASPREKEVEKDAEELNSEVKDEEKVAEKSREIWNVNPSGHNLYHNTSDYIVDDPSGTNVDQPQKILNKVANTNIMGPLDEPEPKQGRRGSPSRIPRSSSISPQRLTCRQEVDRMFDSKKGKR